VTKRTKKTRFGGFFCVLGGEMRLFSYIPSCALANVDALMLEIALPLSQPPAAPAENAFQIIGYV
jgi:hypothetical protein